MAITQGTGDQTNPYILTCWNDLYSITWYRTSYFKFVDNYFEDLSITYPSGNVPEVPLFYSGDDLYTAAAEIDFNGATFINGRFDGFKIASLFTSNWLSDITMTIKNLNIKNMQDTGQKGGFLHCTRIGDTPETVYTPVTILGCDLEIEGETSDSTFLYRNAQSSRWTGSFEIRESRITLKGYETLSATLRIYDSIINYNNVIFSKTTNIIYYDAENNQHNETFATHMPPKAVEDTYDNDTYISFSVRNALFTGSLRSSGAPTAHYITPQDNVIWDVKCDKVIIGSANAAIAINTDKVGEIVIADGKQNDVNKDAIHEGSSADIINRDKLYEWGFGIRPNN